MPANSQRQSNGRRHKPAVHPRGDTPLFSTAELKQLAISCLAFQPGQTEHDFERILGWAERTRVNATLLKLMLDGEVGAVWIDEDDDVLVGLIA